MSNKIFYFSGTGNSLAVARELAKELGETAVIPISEAIKGDISLNAERIGIVFPVYMFGLPLMVAEFVKKLKCPTQAYVFAVATYGGLLAATLIQMKKLLARNNITLAAGFNIIMPSNYIPLYDIEPDEKLSKNLEKAKAKMLEIAEIIKKRKVAPVAAGNFLVNALFSGLIYKISSPRIPAMDKSYRATDKCNGCGICESVCPVNNIEMANGKPVWKHKCEQCVACLHWCPQEAIQFGSKTATRRRYHHPDIKLEDMINS